MACFTKNQQRNRTNCEFEKYVTTSNFFVLNPLAKIHLNPVCTEYVCDKNENARNNNNQHPLINHSPCPTPPSWVPMVTSRSWWNTVTLAMRWKLVLDVKGSFHYNKCSHQKDKIELRPSIFILWGLLHLLNLYIAMVAIMKYNIIFVNTLKHLMQTMLQNQNLQSTFVDA